ncbi:MAG: zinc-ribbon and DUF3426 domain-containing protein [Pseudomonadota bacterium]
MNYITACPACETQFLITKEHLKAYRGKVQCGNCKHIFNAKNRLTEVSNNINSVEDYSVAEQNNTEVFSSSPTNSNENDTAFLDVPSETVDGEKPINEKLNIVLEAVPDLSDLASESTFIQTEHTSYAGNQPPSIISEQVIDSVRAPILIEDLTADPSFQLTRPKRSFWLLPIICLLLILALLQSIYFLRSQIAANYPQFKPYLIQACEHLRCKINLPKHLKLLTIDDSDMQESEQYQNVIHFSSLLINNANHIQAYPNIELTLTDNQDMPVLRKLLKPEDYLETTNNVSAGIAANAEERIKLAINVQNLTVAGYRVLLTY